MTAWIPLTRPTNTARAEALGLRRASLTARGLKLNRETRIVVGPEIEVRLSFTESRLLELFIRGPERVFSRDEIADWIWPGERVDARTVDVNVGRLRRSLGPCRAWIHTVRGQGYSFSRPQHVGRRRPRAQTNVPAHPQQRSAANG